MMIRYRPKITNFLYPAQNRTRQFFAKAHQIWQQ